MFLVVLNGLSMVAAPGRRCLTKSTNGSERRAELGCEQTWLLPCREVAAPVHLVVVDQLRICALRPAPGGLVLLSGEHGYRNWNGDALGVEESTFVFPIQARRGDAGVG